MVPAAMQPSWTWKCTRKETRDLSLTRCIESGSTPPQEGCRWGCCHNTHYCICPFISCTIFTHLPSNSAFRAFIYCWHARAPQSVECIESRHLDYLARLLLPESESATLRHKYRSVSITRSWSSWMRGPARRRFRHPWRGSCSLSRGAMRRYGCDSKLASFPHNDLFGLSLRKKLTWE